MSAWAEIVGGRKIVVVANRLPVDRVVLPSGETEWRQSPGGLVTAMESIVRDLGCVWVGWSGDTGEHTAPFTHGSMQLVPVELDETDFEYYYEGFSNSTLWPLYHDAIAPPRFHREWWDRYVLVNRKFTAAAAREAPEQAIVWIHDYQLQLVPQMLRELRPDLTIVFFLHIPFPSRRLFAQLPWRKDIVAGLLGADVVGFQREQDAQSFRFAAQRYAEAHPHGNLLIVPNENEEGNRTVLTQEFPISIDVDHFSELAAHPDTIARASEIRRELGSPKILMLGVDRLDYTKGIQHRLKAFSELLVDGEVSSEEVVLVQVASPSRERVAAYRELREEVEREVGSINGAHGSFERTPLVYLHRSYSREEMTALYLAADVLVVTSLRDGMNLVAKEYVACRNDEHGALVLSEFTGASDELRDAIHVNPHDIEGMKSAFLRAIHMPKREQQRRMKALRRSVEENDVHHWAESFLRAAMTVNSDASPATDFSESTGASPGDTTHVILHDTLEAPLRRLATEAEVLVACDFDGTLAPIVARPQDARMLERARRALDVLAQSSGVHIAILSGRSIDSLLELGVDSDWLLSGSHGAEFRGGSSSELLATPLTSEEADKIVALHRRFARLFSDEPRVRLERKPFAIAVHTRQVENAERSEELLDMAAQVGLDAGFTVREGKRVRECTLRVEDKGTALRAIRALTPSARVLFIGDDVTDEDAFHVLEHGDLGIKVGEGDTAATERVHNPEAVAEVLAQLVQLRTGTVIGTEAQ